MAEVEYFDEVFVFANLVIGENRAVKQFADTRAFTNDAAHVGKARLQFHVV